MPRPDVIIPPGELIYKYMSFSGSSASKKSNWAIISDAIESSIGVPKKTIRSFNSLENISNAL